MKTSTAAPLLRGLAWEGTRIVTVEASRKGINHRAIITTTGVRHVVPKAQVVALTQQVLNRRGRQTAIRSWRESPDGTVTIRLGGPIKGQRKTFQTSAAAKAAITKKYGKF